MGVGGEENGLGKKRAGAVLKRIAWLAVKNIPLLGGVFEGAWEVWDAYRKAGEEEGLSPEQTARLLMLLERAEAQEAVSAVLETPEARESTTRLSPPQQQELRERLTQLPTALRLLPRPPEDETDVAKAILCERLTRFDQGYVTPDDKEYVLEHRLGGGGFGEVWAARDFKGRRVAVKFCLDPADREPLETELRAIRRLYRHLSDHRGFVEFLDFALQGDPSYLVMELCADDLRRHMKPGQEPLAPERCLELMLDPLRALKAAHSAPEPIVHRDIKPANILLGFDDKARLGDFGLARVAVQRNIQSIERSAKSGRSSRAKGAGIAGTALYMAPEVKAGEVKADDIDALKCADVYSFGLTLLQLLAANQSLEGGRLPGKLRKSLPDALVELVEAATEPHPDDRLADAGELFAACEKLAIRPAPAVAVAVAPSSPPPPSPPRSPSQPAPPPAPPKAKERRPGELLTLDCGGIPMNLIWMPAGTFKMGSPKSEEGRYDDEGPQTQVTLTEGFWMAEAQTTQAQWKAIMGNNPSHLKGDNLPVEKISWNDAIEFCKKLSSKTGQRIGLPTEAQWEYACRAETTTRFSYGDGDSQLGDYAWFSSNSNSQTHPVKQKPPNPWGLYDMHGNVWEWCADWFGAYPGGSITDFSGSKSGSVRVCRGGSWFVGPRDLRSAVRLRLAPAGAYYGLGFRVAAVPAP